MPHVYSLQAPGAPTATAKSARPSSFGLDSFATPVDPDLMDREWYHSQGYYPHHAPSRLSPADDVLTALAFSYPAHTQPDSEALAGMSTSFLLSSSLPSNPIALLPTRMSSVAKRSSAIPPGAAACNLGFRDLRCAIASSR
jgi:hypothetical protein